MEYRWHGREVARDSHESDAAARAGTRRQTGTDDRFALPGCDPSPRVGAVSADEFAEFYAASFRRLVGQLYAMTGDGSEAQDAVQEAFVRAWANRSSLHASASPEAWVRSTAWRIAVSRWHRTRRGWDLLRSRPPPPGGPAARLGCGYAGQRTGDDQCLSLTTNSAVLLSRLPMAHGRCPRLK